MRLRVAIATVMFGAAVGTLGAVPAQAGTDAVDPEIAAVLAEVPGGVIIDANHAVWPEIGMEMTTATNSRMSTLAAVGSCSSGYVCAYTNYGLGGTKLGWNSCGDHGIPSTFGVKSIADARSSGRLQARNGSTVHATANAGTWANVYSGPTTYVRCTL